MARKILGITLICAPLVALLLIFIVIGSPGVALKFDACPMGPILITAVAIESLMGIVILAGGDVSY